MVKLINLVKNKFVHAERLVILVHLPQKDTKGEEKQQLLLLDVEV
jgi:hypothetical protein